jgi:hypothetical protein
MLHVQADPGEGNKTYHQILFFCFVLVTFCQSLVSLDYFQKAHRRVSQGVHGKSWYGWHHGAGTSAPMFSASETVVLGSEGPVHPTQKEMGREMLPAVLCLQCQTREQTTTLGFLLHSIQAQEMWGRKFSLKASAKFPVTLNACMNLEYLLKR